MVKIGGGLMKQKLWFLKTGGLKIKANYTPKFKKTIMSFRGDLNLKIDSNIEIFKKRLLEFDYQK